MQLDHFKDDTVTYRPEAARRPGGLTVRSASRRVQDWGNTDKFIVSSFTATTAAIVFYTGVASVVGFVDNSVVFGEFIAGHARNPLTPTRIEAPSGSRPILEMRPANRPLADKAREELSEFERDYPW